MKTYTKEDFHNPENLTRQQVGEEHRLLLPEEVGGRFGNDADNGELYHKNVPQWLSSSCSYTGWTYRVLLATPLPDGTVLTSNECCWADDAVQPEPQPKQPYNSDERAEWDVDAQHTNPEYTDAPYDAIDIKFHPNDPKGAAGAKKAPMHLLPPLPLMRLAWAMGHGAAKYGANNFLDAKVLASTYIGAIGRHWAQFSSGEDNDNDSGLSHIALLAANCMILMAAADAGTLIDDRRKP